MTKIVLDNILTGYQSLQTTNANNSIVVNAIDNTVSRDGTAPNYMAADFDMNSHRILNLPTPQTPNEPARLIDITSGAVLTALSLITVTVDTIAALKAYTMSSSLASQLIYVRGYSAIGDGGDGLFRITTTSPGADNSGTIIWSTTSGYYFVRQFVGAVYARWFDTLAHANTAAFALGRPLAIDSTYTLAANTTFTADVVFIGGRINQNNFNLIFSGGSNLSNQQTQAFDPTYIAKLTLSKNMPPIKPEWWGAVGDATTNDYTAVQAAITYVTNNGGTVWLHGTYQVNTALSVSTLSTSSLTYTIDGAGGYIKPNGAIYGMVISCFNNTMGPVVRNVVINQNGAWVAGSTGGFYLHGAIACELQNCTVITSQASLGAGRTSYYAYRIDATGAFGSYWAILKGCMNYVPDSTGTGTYIKAGCLIEDDCNNCKIIECRFNDVESGVRVIADYSGSAAGAGQPNCIVVRDLAVEGSDTAGVYIIHTSSVADPYIYGLVIDGLRYEPGNAGTFAINIGVTGAGPFSNSSETPRLSNIRNVGGNIITGPAGFAYKIDNTTATTVI